MVLGGQSSLSGGLFLLLEISFLKGTKGKLNYGCFNIISCFDILVIYNSEVFTHFIVHLPRSPSISASLFNIHISVLYYLRVIKSVLAAW